MAGAAFRCGCGAVTGQVTPCTRASGTRVQCFCASCRQAELHLDQPDPAEAGVGLFLTTADTIRFDTGAERLGCFQLSRSGPLRWFATCCNSSLFNTAPRRQFPFAAVQIARLEDADALGPIRLRTFLPGREGRNRHAGNRLAFFQVIGRVLLARVSGRWRNTPFFDAETGRPVVSPQRAG